MQDFHFYVVIADVVLSKKLLFCLYEMVSDDGLCTTRSCFLVTPEFFISRPYLGKCARRGGKQGLDRSQKQTHRYLSTRQKFSYSSLIRNTIWFTSSLEPKSLDKGLPYNRYAYFWTKILRVEPTVGRCRVGEIGTGNVWGW